jgi:hypothetical protein
MVATFVIKAAVVPAQSMESKTQSMHSLFLCSVPDFSVKG